MTTVNSTFQNKPAYHYIRESDRLPTYEELGDASFEDMICKVRLFNPTGIGTWWIVSLDPEDGIAWGVAELTEREAGSISMGELVSFRGQFNLPIERDLHYKPVSVQAVLDRREGD